MLTRDEAAIEMAAELRGRALRGETLLLGMVVRCAWYGEGEYVGGEKDSYQGCYTFRFGDGATSRTEQMNFGLMEPEQWSVSPCAGAVEARDGMVEEGNILLEQMNLC